MIVIAGLLLTGIGVLAIITGATRDGGSALAATTSSTAITAIDLRVSVTPPAVRAGDDIRVAAYVSIRGGPGPVTLSAIVPKGSGPGQGTDQGSATFMLDANAVYALDLPMGIDSDKTPGTYSYIITVQAGRVSVTRTAVLVVLPPLP
jgi:hypothetical protein